MIAFKYFLSLFIFISVVANSSQVKKILICDHFKVLYDGHGLVSCPNGQFIMSTKVPDESAATHAALILSKEPDTEKEFQVDFTFTLDRQLRKGGANPWETLWFFFDYIPKKKSDIAYDKDTYYTAFKTNGIELGRAFGKNEQAFIKTTEDFKFIKGKKYNIKIHRSQNLLQVFVNGDLRFMHNGALSKQNNEFGYYGFYVEDAQVQVSLLHASFLK